MKTIFTSFRQIFLLLSLLYFSCSNNEPVPPEINIAVKNWKIYNTENSGLSDNSTVAICIDKTNNLWVGTFAKGIAMYNGSIWTLYNKNNSSLPTDSILCIESDKNNNIWIGSDNGLAKINGNEWTIYNTTNSILPYRVIFALAADNNNVLWIGCGYSTGGGLVSFDGNKWKLYTTKNSSLPNSIIHTIHIDKYNNKWIGTDGGLVRIDNSGNWTVYTKNNSNLIYNSVDAITTDPDNNIWIGCRAKVYLDKYYYHGSLQKYNGYSWNDYRPNGNGEYNPGAIVSNRVSHLACDKYGYLWISTDVEGKFNYNLSIFKDRAWKNICDVIKDFNHPFILDIKLDNNNNVWLATQLGVISINYEITK